MQAVIADFKINRYLTVHSIICFLLLALVSIMVWSSPATGYEASIYKAVPPVFWGVLFFCILSGISIIVYQIFKRGEENSSLYIIGLLLMILPYILILSLSIIRGYFLYGSGDVMSHYDYVRSICLSGHLSKDNIYPISHILAAQCAQILGIDITLLFSYISLIFNILYVIFMYLLVKAILPEKGQVIFAIAGSVTLIYSWWAIYYAPNQLANLFLPLAFYLFFRKNSWVAQSVNKANYNYSFLFCVILILYPVFHQVSALGLFLLIITIWLPARLIIRNNKTVENNNEQNFIIPKLDLTATLIIFIWLITWISSFYIWEYAIRNTYAIITEGAPTYLEKFTEDALYAQQYGYSIVQLFFKNYGGALVYVILTLLAFPILLKKIAKDKRLLYLFSLYGPLPAYALATLLLFLANLPATPLRMVAFVVLVALIFTGFMLSEMVAKARKLYWSGKRRLSIFLCALVVLILFGSYINGTLKLYPSPYTLYANDQVTRHDFLGMKWFFERKDTGILTSSFSIPQGRFAVFLLTSNERSNRKDILNSFTPTPEELKLPFHFGYDKGKRLGEFYDKNTYLVLNKKDQLIYREVYPDMADIRFTSSDFEKLDEDDSLNKLYENGEFTMRYIYALRS